MCITNNNPELITPHPYLTLPVRGTGLPRISAQILHCHLSFRSNLIGRILIFFSSPKSADIHTAAKRDNLTSLIFRNESNKIFHAVLTSQADGVAGYEAG